MTALGALALAVLATFGVSLASGGESEQHARGSGHELVGEGAELNQAGHPRRAVEALKGALKQLGGSAPERVLAKANFELGVALRKLGKFEAARKPLNRSRLFGVSAAAVGVELAKAEAGIRG